MALSKEQLMGEGRPPLVTEDIPVKELGGDVRIRLLSYLELKQISSLEKRKEDSDPYVFKCAVLTDDNAQAFADEKESKAFLATIPTPAFKTLIDAIVRMNHLDKESRQGN